MVLDMIQYSYQKMKKTFGEMKFSLKHKIDHRFKAFKKIKKISLNFPSSILIKI